MRTKLLLALAASGWIIVCYLLFEKLVFGGRMWERLRDTCRLRNRSLWRRLRRFSCRIFDTVLPEETEAQEPQEPIVSSDPVVRVVYVNGPERPRTDTGENGESNDEQSDNFASTERKSDTGPNGLQADRSVPKDSLPANQEKADHTQKDLWGNLGSDGTHDLTEKSRPDELSQQTQDAIAELLADVRESETDEQMILYEMNR